MKPTQWILQNLRSVFRPGGSEAIERKLSELTASYVQYYAPRKRDLSMERTAEGVSKAPLAERSLVDEANAIIDAAKARWAEEDARADAELASRSASNEKAENGDPAADAAAPPAPAAPPPVQTVTPPPVQAPPVVQTPPVAQPATQPQPSPQVDTTTQPPPSPSQASPPALSERARNAGWGSTWQPQSPAESQPPADAVVPPKSPQADTTTTLPADQPVTPPPVAQPAGNANPAPALENMVAKYGQPELGRYSKLPEFYYERDEAGNRMVDLLALRDQAKGAAAKRDIKLHIDAWTRQYDKLSRGSKVGKPITGPAVEAWQAVREAAATTATEPAGNPQSTGPDAGIPEPPVQQPSSGSADTGGPAPQDLARDFVAIEAAKTLGVDPTEGAADGPAVSDRATAADSIQAGLDALGVVGDAVVPGLGVAADGVNAVMSLGRAVTDPGRAGQHLSNAAISAVSMFPFVGDAAKLLKGTQYAALAEQIAGQHRMRKAAAKLLKNKEYAALAEHVAAHRRTGKVGEGQSGAAAPDAGSAAGGAQGATAASGGGGGTGGANPAVSPGDSDDPEGRGIRFSRAMDAGTDAVLKFAGPVGLAAAGLFGFFRGISDTNKRLLEVNKGLSEYNGNIAATYADQTAHEIERERRRGESMSNAIDRMAVEQRRLNEHLDPIANAASTAVTHIQAEMTRAANTMIESHKMLITGPYDAAKAIAKMLGYDPDTGGTSHNDAAHEFFKAAADGKFDPKPPRFGTRSRGN